VIHRGMRIDRPSAAAKAGRIPGVRTPIIIGRRAMAANGLRRGSASTRPKSCARSRGKLSALEKRR